MKYVWTIMRKELARVFKTPSLIFSLFIMPGLLLYILYTVIGNGVQSMQHQNLTIELLNPPAGIVEALNENYNVKEVSSEPTGQVVNIFIGFDENFDDKVMNGEKPLILILYNSGNSQQVTSIDAVMTVLSTYRALHYGDVFQIAPVDTAPADQQQKNLGMVIMASMMPMLIMSFLFSGVMGVAPESIAGEKERGTINTLLSTPVKRNYIAVGKILSLSLLATISAFSSFLGVALSLPAMYGDAVGSGAGAYSFWNYMQVLVVLVVSVFVVVGVVSLISAFSKTIQQATTMSLPLMFISMIVGLTTLITNSAATTTVLYIIPLFNTSQILYQIFTNNVNIVQFIITICSNIATTMICGYVLTRMFNSERIMFRK